MRLWWWWFQLKISFSIVVHVKIFKHKIMNLPNTEMGVWSNFLVCYDILRGSTPFCSHVWCGNISWAKAEIILSKWPILGYGNYNQCMRNWCNVLWIWGWQIPTCARYQVHLWLEVWFFTWLSPYGEGQLHLKLTLKTGIWKSQIPHHTTFGY